jgi:hypothetical protein
MIVCAFPPGMGSLLTALGTHSTRYTMGYGEAHEPQHTARTSDC